MGISFTTTQGALKMLQLIIWKLTIVSLILGVYVLLDGMIITALALDAIGMFGVYFIFCSEYYGE